MRTAFGCQGGEGASWWNLVLQDVRSKFFDTAAVSERRVFVDEGSFLIDLVYVLL